MDCRGAFIITTVSILWLFESVSPNSLTIVPPFSAVGPPYPQPSSSPASDLSSTTVHAISRFVFYSNLTHISSFFTLSLSSVFIFRLFQEAILNPVWRKAMNEEMQILVSRLTWDLVCAPLVASIVGSHLIYTV